MTAPPVTGAAARPDAAPAHSLLDRLLSAIPLASIVVWLALVGMFETVGRKSPTIFTDELEWAQISRSIADDGHPARRGAAISFKTLYVFLLAPVWWIHDTAAAYDAAKYLNVAVMCLAAVPAYALARRLVSKPAALIVAAATIATPAMVYAGYLVPEVLAYPWSVLCAWFAVGSLAGRGRRWTIAAVVCCAIAPVVRLQLAVVPAAYVLAAVALWWTAPRARALRRNWTRGDAVGFWLLAFGAFVVVNRAVLDHSNQWWYVSEFWRHRIFDYATWSFGALTIGIGILPTVGGLVALMPRREERREPEDRAFLAFLASALLAYGLYAGVKGAYLSTQFASRVAERNVIYAAPLLFVATAVVLERRRIRLWPVVIATAATVWLMATVPIQLEYPYYEALGFGILDLGNRELWLSQATLQRWVVAIAVIGGVLLLGAWYAGRRGVARARGVRAALGVVAALVIAWNLTGQVYIAMGANDNSKAFVAGAPLDPPNLLDKLTGGASVTYLGQQVVDPNGIHLLEFWNRSIKNVWTLDGTAPGPGPTVSPDLALPDGTLRPPPPTAYALTDSGIELAQKPVWRQGPLMLYRLGPQWRLRSFQDGVSNGGWIGRQSAYSLFAGAPRGTLVVSAGRTGFCPQTKGPPPARVTIRFGPVVVNANHQPALGRDVRTYHLVVPNCEQREQRIPVGPPPWRTEVAVDGLFRPSEFGGSDARELGVQVGYGFEPARAARRSGG